jgi:hypothetical protein
MFQQMIAMKIKLPLSIRILRKQNKQNYITYKWKNVVGKTNSFCKQFSFDNSEIEKYQIRCGMLWGFGVWNGPAKSVVCWHFMQNKLTKLAFNRFQVLHAQNFARADLKNILLCVWTCLTLLLDSAFEILPFPKHPLVCQKASPKGYLDGLFLLAWLCYKIWSMGTIVCMYIQTTDKLTCKSACTYIMCMSAYVRAR